MDEFGYLSVLLSIILGLAVTQILTGFRGLVLTRTRVRTYWPVIVWGILILLICTQNWWSMFGLRDRHVWTFLQFAMVLLNTILIYMMAALVFPDFSGDEIVDLRESYFGHRAWFYAIAAATTIVSITKERILEGRMPTPMNLAFQMFFTAMAVIAAIVRNETFHKTVALMASALFVLYIVLLFARLQ